MGTFRPCKQLLYVSDTLQCKTPTGGHHALVWMFGFRMAGFMLSGSGIRVFLFGNMGLGWGGWGKVQFNDGERWGCGRDGVWRGTGVVEYVVY